MNQRDKIAIKVLILDKISSVQKDTLEVSTCTPKAFDLLISQIEDYLNLLKKVNRELK